MDPETQHTPAPDQSPVTAAELRDEMRAELRHLREINAELLAALKMIRFRWAGHSEVCAMIDGNKCDCDWPMVAAKCDAAIARAESGT